MSGPKIVRIVTREEVEDICRSHLRAVDTAVAQLKRCAERHDLWTEDYAAAVKSRKQVLLRLIENERWLDVQKEAPREIAFLRSKMERITTAAISAAEAASRRRRRLADAAHSVIMALEAAGREVPGSLRQAAERASMAKPGEIAAIEAKLNGAMSLLGAAGGAPGPSEQQRELASRLGAGEEHRSIADWLATQPSDSDSDRRLDRLSAEMEVLDRDEAAPFITRAAEIGQERSANHRALLTDSLVLDLAARLAERRTWESLLVSLEDARATLESLRIDAATVLLERLKAAVQAESAEQASAVIVATRKLAETETRHKAAHARRLAVLQGLASLGYEVRENMATALAQSGRIVIKKPGVTDYGVELGAVADAERMQVRLVGAANPMEARNAARDRDAEAQWCSQLSELQIALGSNGSKLVIERALPVGAQPVKTVVFEGAGGPTISEIAKPKGRHLG